MEISASFIKITPLDGQYILAIVKGSPATQWPVHTGHWAGRPPCVMAGTHWPSGGETSLLNGQ